jgi:hypothetical protein
MEAIINTNAQMSKSVGDRRMVDITILMKKSKAKDIPMLFTVLMGYKKFHTIPINFHVNGQGETAFFTLPDTLFTGLF